MDARRGTAPCGPVMGLGYTRSQQTPMPLAPVGACRPLPRNKDATPSHMNGFDGYAVFFFPPALEALGDAIKPYLQDGPAGVHVPCREVDTAGAFIELTLQGRTSDGRDISLDLMVPGNMVRMIVSVRSNAEFGFHDRRRVPQVMIEPGLKAHATGPDEVASKPAGEMAGASPDAKSGA